MTKVIDFGNLDTDALRASVDDEAQADLLAVSGHFAEAAKLMASVNKAREKVFGKWPARELREFTELALSQHKESTDE